jgi:hypothetical protein
MTGRIKVRSACYREMISQQRSQRIDDKLYRTLVSGHLLMMCASNGTRPSDELSS